MSVYNDTDQMRDHSANAIPTSRPRYQPSLHPNVSTRHSMELACTLFMKLVLFMLFGKSLKELY